MLCCSFPRADARQKVNCAFGVFSVLVLLAGLQSGKNLNPLINRGDTIYVELAIANRFDDILFQHEIADVVLRYYDALFACETLGFADLKKAFDLVRGSTMA